MISTTLRLAGFLLCGLLIDIPMAAGAREYGGASIVIDHRHTDITQLTEEQINRAKEVLHIAYGHTSHGSQLTDGMSGLVDFANGGGKGLALPHDIFAWNHGGSGGALDLHDYAMDGDVGYYPDWVRNTTNYLNNPANADVNVVVWSWCGQMGDKYAAGTLSSEYLLPMADLERRYPGVVFVYMTGHVDIWDDADNKAACEAIRTWCASGSRVLYDFNDIERHNPDGTYYQFVGDDCSVYASAGGGSIGNWATAWQAAHTEGVDWYDCSSAHSQPLNANQKAYAAWALWCRLAEGQQTPVLSVTPIRRPVGFAAGTTTFAVANAGGGTMAYSAAESESWLSIQSGGSGGDSGTITVEHAENPSKVARTGTVTVTASGAVGSPVAATVVQDPLPFQDPFPSAVPWPAPGTVEMENFDMGTPGMAYFDSTAANEGAQYRPSDGVDIAQDAGAGNNHVVGWTRAGEWLEYTVNVSAPGTYVLETRVAAVGSGGQFRIRIDGVDQTGLLSVPNTGAWNAYQIAQKTGVALSSGIQTVRVEMATAGTSGNVGAFDWFRVAVDVLVAQSAYPSGTPWTLPGTVEIENFDLGGQGVAYSDATTANEGGQYRSTGVDIARDTGAGNSNVVGWTPAGEWLEYTVNVGAGGTYALETRVAAVGTGGQFRIWVNGADKTGPLTVPNTGAWNAYQIVQKTGVALSSGIQTVRVEMVTAGMSGSVGAFDWFRVVAAAPPPTRSPYPSGTPWTLPGTVEIENFDLGGEGAAYHDATTVNEGGQYRTSDGVDIARDAGAGNSHVVGWTPAGEWLEYTVNVLSPGTHVLETRVAAVGTGGRFRFLVNGMDQTGLLTVPNTGAWNAYQIVQKTGVALSSGIQTVRVELVTAGTSGNVGAFDWFRVVAETPVAQSAYPSGAPWALPGTVEIENFDLGGQGVAYNDATTANEGGQYRVADGVDIARDAGAGNSHVVGWTPAGEWLEYTVNVGATGTYTFEMRVAGVGAGGQFRIWVNGVDKTGLLIVPNTGAWSAYQTVSKTGVALSSGIQTVRVELATAGTSGHVGAFDWFRAQSGSARSANAVDPVAGKYPIPVIVRTSDENRRPEEGWLAVDGDPESVWTASGRAGSWICLGYARPVPVWQVDVRFTDDSPKGLLLLASEDGLEWIELDPARDLGGFEWSYLWLLFPGAPLVPPPAVREIEVRDSSVR